jgi:hypothetical protein
MNAIKHDAGLVWRVSGELRQKEGGIDVERILRNWLGEGNAQRLVGSGVICTRRYAGGLPPFVHEDEFASTVAATNLLASLACLTRRPSAIWKLLSAGLSYGDGACMLTNRSASFWMYK